MFVNVKLDKVVYIKLLVGYRKLEKIVRLQKAFYSL